MSEIFFNRELSWIEFNSRVLSEAENRDVPLLERLKFLSIVSSNFDEFFMVRVASVRRQMEAQSSGSCPTGMSPRDQLIAIQDRVRDLNARAYAVLLEEIFPALAQHGITRIAREDWDAEQQSFVRRFFREQLEPVLTPVRITRASDLASVGNLLLHAAFLLVPVSDHESAIGLRDEPAVTDDVFQASLGDGSVLALVQVPPSLERLVYLPVDRTDTVAFTFLEQVILSEAHRLFPGFTVQEQCLFRITRDADFGVDEGRDEDFVEAMEQVLETRDHSAVIRMNINQGSKRLRDVLSTAMGLPDAAVFESPDPLELRSLMDVVSIEGYSSLRDARQRPVGSAWVDEEEPIWDSIRRRDILLHHPFESFDPVVRMVQEAAEDDATLAIKMTLYRTSGDSPIIRALELAAERGKQVSVLVEIKARFDEQRNIGWAQRLQRAGVVVVYGIARLKVHSKALLVVRRESDGIRRYVHLGTGNYNDKTAKLYTDLSLMTCSESMAYEVGRVFNAITGYSSIPSFETLSIAPVGLKRRLLDMIEREANRAAAGGNGLIVAKMNSLADPDVIKALYAASQAGVEVRLNVRGICMLVPGLKGVSENIRVISVIDRYLEHTRAFYFENGGNADVFISSADWMPRNLEKRVELLVPVENTELKRRIRRILDIFFEDNTKAHELERDGSWRRVKAKKGERPFRAQDVAYARIRERSLGDEPENRQEFRVRREAPR